MNAYFNQYHQAQVGTSSPEQILIMLYDGAIRFCVRAKEALAAGDQVQRAEAVGRVMAIVSTFAETLDHEIGGEIASNLDALYNYMIRELTQANLSKDPKHLQIVEDLLRDLRETWLEAIEKNRQEQMQKRTETAEQPRQMRAAAW